MSRDALIYARMQATETHGENCRKFAPTESDLNFGNHNFVIAGKRILSQVTLYFPTRWKVFIFFYIFCLILRNERPVRLLQAAPVHTIRMQQYTQHKIHNKNETENKQYIIML